MSRSPRAHSCDTFRHQSCTPAVKANLPGRSAQDHRFLATASITSLSAADIRMMSSEDAAVYVADAVVVERVTDTDERVSGRVYGWRRFLQAKASTANGSGLSYRRAPHTLFLSLLLHRTVLSKAAFRRGAPVCPFKSSASNIVFFWTRR